MLIKKTKSKGIAVMTSFADHKVLGSKRRRISVLQIG